MESAADFIDEDDFAKSATLNGNDVLVILDKSVFFQDDVATTRPIVVGASAALSGASRNDVLILDGVTYTVSEPPMDDGLLTTLILRNA